MHCQSATQEMLKSASRPHTIVLLASHVVVFTVEVTACLKALRIPNHWKFLSRSFLLLISHTLIILWMTWWTCSTIEFICADEMPTPILRTQTGSQHSLRTQIERVVITVEWFQTLRPPNFSSRLSHQTNRSKISIQKH